MSFDSTKPQATDLLSQSQADLQTNFSQSNTIFGVDHVNFDNSLPAGAAIADRGKHIPLHIKRDAFATASPTTASDEGAVYTKEAAASGRVEAYYRYPSNGAVTQLSAIKAWCRFDANVTVGNPVTIADSYNINSATTVRASGTSYTIKFTTALTNANYMVLVTGPNGYQVSTASWATDGFTLGFNTTPTGSSIVHFLVIGN